MDDNKFVDKIFKVLEKFNLNKEENANLKEACQMVSDLMEEIKESKVKIKESEAKIKKSEAKIKESEAKIQNLKLIIDKNNKEFKRKQNVIKKLETQNGDLEEEHKERIEEMLKEHEEIVDNLKKELSEARKKQFIFKT